jgi:predicted nucleic acid-binding protein
MSGKVFLDTGIFFDCLRNQDRKTIINHAINRDYRIFTSLSVIGEVILIMKKNVEMTTNVRSVRNMFS